VVVKIPLFASNFGLQTSIVQKQSAIICAICGKQISVNQWQLKNRKVSIPQMAQISAEKNNNYKNKSVRSAGNKMK